MQHLHPIDKDEMVAVFLRTELAASRLGPTIAANRSMTTPATGLSSSVGTISVTTKADNRRGSG